MIDPAALQIVLSVLIGSLGRREREAVPYLVDENRLLRRQLGNRRLHDRENLESPWSAADPAAPELVANVSESPLARHRWRRLLHDGRLNVAGLVTYYTVFVIDVASRRVQILGSTTHPKALFLQQVARTLTMAEASAARLPRLVIRDRDRKWSGEVRLYDGENETTEEVRRWF
jgi:hypothetical protein